ncbi:MAG: hypothetical protein H7062_19580 [Candidatus Saccharimonas sp.]|nr:hypothetical protein [Planctomycetaceae bacterium]
MQTIHAILAIRQRLYRDLMHSMLTREPDVHIVPPLDDEGSADDECHIATRLFKLLEVDEFAVDDPVIVVISIEDTKEIPASVSRLLSEFPEVTIVGICWATAHVRSFQLRIDVQEIPCSVKGLVEAIRECTRHPLPW